MIKVEVKASACYDVIIGSGVISQVGEKIKSLLPKTEKVAVVTDATVEKLYLDVVNEALLQVGLSSCVYVVSPGESSKSGSEFLSLLEWLNSKQITRTDCLIALGGGVVGDLCGFVAATYLRGTPFIQLPTTLLAMVDSSVGGKTGINLKAGKNLAGAFYQPACVLCDVNTLSTLPRETFNEGMAEVIKYGMLRDSRLLDQLSSEPIAENLDQIIATCVAMKRDIVQNDEFDRGERQLLNFGHTVGHAIERQSKYKISHGYAVAIGMMIETGIGVKQGFCSMECLSLLKNLLGRFDLPNQTEYTSDELFEGVMYDKKRAGDIITVAFPFGIGKCKLEAVQIKEFHNWIEMGLTLCK